MIIQTYVLNGAHQREKYRLLNEQQKRRVLSETMRIIVRVRLKYTGIIFLKNLPNNEADGRL